MLPPQPNHHGSLQDGLVSVATIAACLPFFRSGDRIVSKIHGKRGIVVAVEAHGSLLEVKFDGEVETRRCYTGLLEAEPVPVPYLSVSPSRSRPSSPRRLRAPTPEHPLPPYTSSGGCSANSTMTAPPQRPPVRNINGRFAIAPILPPAGASIGNCTAGSSVGTCIPTQARPTSDIFSQLGTGSPSPERQVSQAPNLVWASPVKSRSVEKRSL